MWAGPRNDVLVVLATTVSDDYMATPAEDGDVVLFRMTDADDESTGPVVGVEIIDFLTFDRWGDLPELPMLWQLPGWELLPLVEALQRTQEELRRRAQAPVSG